MLTLWTSEKCFNWCLMQLFFFSPNGVNKAESEGSLNVSCGSMQGRQAVKTDPASNQCSTDRSVLWWSANFSPRNYVSSNLTLSIQLVNL